MTELRENFLPMPPISRRNYLALAATLPFLPSLASCGSAPFNVQSLHKLKNSHIRPEHISFDPQKPAVQTVLDYHYRFANQDLRTVLSASLPLSTPIAMWLATSLLSTLQNAAPAQRSLEQIGCFGTLKEQYQLISSVRGQLGQWSSEPIPLTQNSLPLFPHLGHQTGLFIPAGTPIKQRWLNHISRVYDTGCYIYHADTVSHALNAWLTINSGTNIIRDQIRASEQPFLWESCFLSAQWYSPFTHHMTARFHAQTQPSDSQSPSRESFPIDFLIGSSPVPTIQHPFPAAQIPLSQFLAYQIFLPPPHQNLTDIIPSLAQAHRLLQNPQNKQRPVLLPRSGLDPYRQTGHALLRNDQAAAHASGPYGPGTLPLCGKKAYLSDLASTLSVYVNENGISPIVNTNSISSTQSISIADHDHFFFANRPFIFRLVDTSSGLIFAQGVIDARAIM